ncbi:MAG TPA: hypothetical protein PKV73_15945 [Agriterribacter sp.]|nr:hypothetical protein [Agriterribacter sp.]
MRKTYTLVSLVFLTLCTTTQAQIKKGSIFLGGDMTLGISNSKNSNDESVSKQTNFGISPVAGVALKDNFVAGASLNGGFSNYTYSNQTSQKGNNFGAGVFARHYKNLGKSGFYIFLQNSLNASFGEQRQRNTNSSDQIKINSFTAVVSLYPGISYAATQKLHLETGFNNLLYMNYSHEKRNNTNPAYADTRTNSFSLGTSLNNLSSFYVGFRMLIAK